MKRIYEDAAYAESTGRYWAETGGGHWRRLDQDLHVDTAVIGGGFTGLNAALTLAQGGNKTAVFEAMPAGWGASGRNGGFCCLGGTKLSNAAIKKRYGAQAAATWFETQKNAVTHVRDLLDVNKIDADTHSNGETQVAHSARAWRALQAEARDVQEDYGLDPQLIQKADLATQGLGGPWFGAMTTPLGFGLNPQKYHDGLAKLAQNAGADLYGQSEITGLQAAGSGWRLTAQQRTIHANRVILATNGYSAENLPDWLRARYLPVQSSVIVTRVLTQSEQRAAGWWSSQMAYDSRKLLHYFRLLPDGRFLFGMRGGLSASARSQAGIARKIRSDFARMFPAWQNIEITHHWSGLVCLMPDLMPFVGPVPDHPGLFAAMGFHGNGVAMGSHSGHLLAHHLLRNADLPEVMRRPPGRFPFGRYRRALLAPAYLAAEVFDL